MQLGCDYEFVFVVDGSPDNSLEVALGVASEDPKVRVVELSRNFGQQAAMYAALENASGDFIYALDSDLEEPPENLVPMFQLLQSDKDADVVFGVLNNRSGGFIRNILGQVFYGILDRVSEVAIPKDQAWQRVMSRRYLDALLSYKEVDSLFAGLMALAGFKQLPFQVDKGFKGSTSYSFRRRLSLAVDSVVAFSSRPLVMIASIGLVITFVSFWFSGYLVVKAMLDGNFAPGWASVFVSIWLVGGSCLMCIGIVGIYLAKVFNQTKQRPRYIIRRIHGGLGDGVV